MEKLFFSLNKSRYSNLTIIIFLMLSLPVLAACGQTNNKTLDETAKTVVNAMIKGDEDTLGKLYQKNLGFSFPRTVGGYYEYFNGAKLKDFSFRTEGDTVFITKKNGFKDGLKQIEAKFVQKGQSGYSWYGFWKKY